MFWGYIKIVLYTPEERVNYMNEETNILNEENKEEDKINTDNVELENLEDVNNNEIQEEENQDNEDNEDNEDNIENKFEIDGRKNRRRKDTFTIPTKEVKVHSKTLCEEKIIVIFKRIVPKNGNKRDVANTYTFDINGDCIMLERDAILFWKNRKEIPGMEKDITVTEKRSKLEYRYDKYAEHYNIKEVGLEDSQQR